MKYIKLYEKFEDWNTVSDEELASAQELHLIGVVSSQELRALQRLRQIEQRIINYTGVGDLDLRECALLKSLPTGLEVEGYLSLYRCTGLESLPDGLKVGGYLSLYDCTGLTSLPADLEVGEDLDLTGCTALTSLPSGLVVGRNLHIRGCTSLGELPQDLRVRGRIYR
jgi:hypothetical protein